MNSASASRGINMAGKLKEAVAVVSDTQPRQAYSLPTKHQLTVPMPRPNDVINGAPTPTTVVSDNSKCITNRNHTSPKADNHHVSSNCRREISTVDRREPNSTVDMRQPNSYLSPSPSNVLGTPQLSVDSVHGREQSYDSYDNCVSKRAESDSVSARADKSYQTHRYGISPADLDLLMEAARWTRDGELGIKSKHGTVRGVTNMVRTSIQTISLFKHSDAKKQTAPDERGQVVVYTTSVSAIRRRHESCARALHILHTHGIAFESRDIFISHEHMDELRQRLQVPDTQPDVDVPQIFISGVYLGGIEELENFNETGNLRQMFTPLEKVNDRPACINCFGHRYVICVGCSGSRKSKSYYKTSSVFAVLRCAQCDENGMVPCYLCNPNFRPSVRQVSVELVATSSPTAKEVPRRVAMDRCCSPTLS